MNPYADLHWDCEKPQTRIKLCEFENLDSAYEASFLGCEFLGFHLFSDQDIPVKTAKFEEIFEELPPYVEKTLLTDLEIGKLLPILKTGSGSVLRRYTDRTSGGDSRPISSDPDPQGHVRQIGGK